MSKIRDTSVPQGISVIYWAIVILLVCIIAAIFLICFAAAGVANAQANLGRQRQFGGAGVPAFIQQVGVAGIALGITMIVSRIMYTVGLVMCLTVPASVRGREAIYVAVTCEILGIMVTVLVNTVVIVEPRLALAGGVLILIGAVSFLVFLKNLAIFLRNRKLENKASSTLMIFVVTIVGYILNLVAILALRQAGLALFSFIWFVTGITGTVLFVQLLAGLKYELNRPVRRRRSRGYDPEYDDDEDDDYDRPRRRRRRDDYDDDDDYDRPRRSRRDDYDDDEDDDYDRPRRRRRDDY